jgi:hypothetical protein
MGAATGATVAGRIEGIVMSSRRAANTVMRGISRLREIAVSRRRKSAMRGKAIPKKTKRSGVLLERQRAPAVQVASLFESISWPGVMLLAYTIAWFAIVSSFIFR